MDKLYKIKKEYQEKGEKDNLVYIILEDNGTRVLITPLNSGLSIPPINNILKTMLYEVTQ